MLKKIDQKKKNSPQIDLTGKGNTVEMNRRQKTINSNTLKRSNTSYRKIHRITEAVTINRDPE